MPDRISLVRWRDAKTDPPLRGELVRTDVGPAWLMHDGEWSGEDHFPVQPSVWCDPSPPGDDALTNEQLVDLVEHVLNQSDPELWPEPRAIAARLRRAIEEADR